MIKIRVNGKVITFATPEQVTRFWQLYEGYTK